MPKVSIVIPVYNAEKYLNQCLESLCNQTLTDFEVICVNDGSKDSSLEILKNFASKDSRFIIINKKNEGQGIARNIAIEQAKGEYLLCLDSDDWLEKDGLKKAYNKITADKTDILFFDVYRYIDKEQKKYTLKYTEIYKNFKNQPFNMKSAGKTYLLTNSLPFKLYNLNFIKENNILFSPHKFNEDVPFYIKAMLCAKQISCLSTPIYNYRVLTKSASSNYKKYFECIPQVYDICFDIIKDFETEKDILNSFLENRKISLIYFYEQTPLLYKIKYHKMMQKIIRKHFLPYSFDETLKEIYHTNPYIWILSQKIKQTRLCFKSII